MTADQSRTPLRCPPSRWTTLCAGCIQRITALGGRSSNHMGSSRGGSGRRGHEHQRIGWWFFLWWEGVERGGGVSCVAGCRRAWRAPQLQVFQAIMGCVCPCPSTARDVVSRWGARSARLGAQRRRHLWSVVAPRAGHPPPAGVDPAVAGRQSVASRPPSTCRAWGAACASACRRVPSGVQQPGPRQGSRRVRGGLGGGRLCCVDWGFG